MAILASKASLVMPMSMFKSEASLNLISAFLTLLLTISIPSSVSADRGINVSPSDPLSLNDGTYWALVIGINDYVAANRLATAVKDAEEVAEVLIKKYGFSREHVIQLINDRATRTNIEDALYQVGRRAGVADSVIIYYAGHGQYDDDGRLGWWVPVDGEPEHPGTFITNAAIRDYIRGMKARHVLLVSDSCFSGTLLGTRGLAANSENRLLEIYSKPSRWGFTSGSTEPVADEGKDGHSIFAYHFLKVLTGNQAPYLFASQIYDQIVPIIKNNSSQTPRSQPLVGAGDEGGQFIFQLRNRSESTVLSDIAQNSLKFNPLQSKPNDSNPSQPEAGEQWVTVDGIYPFGDELSISEARLRSLDEARRKAIQQVAGTFLVEKKLLYNDKIVEKLGRSVVRGIITEEHILKDGVKLNEINAERSTYYYLTKLRARVKTLRPELKNDLGVSISLNKAHFKAGEEMVVSISTKKDAYLHIFNVGANGEVTLLLPNRFSQQNYVRGNQTLSFPDVTDMKAGLRLLAFVQDKKKTIEQIKVIATTTNIDFLKGKVQPGLYQVFPGKDSALITDLFKELAALDDDEWAEGAVAFDVNSGEYR